MKEPKPLYDEEAEAALIGAGFLDPQIFINSIEPDDFGMPGYGTLWSACRDLARQEVHPDLVTLPSDVFPPNTTPQTFVDSCPSHTRAKNYAAIVRRWSRRRRLEQAASLFAQAAYENDDEEHAELLRLARETLRASEEGDGWEVLTLADAYEERDPVEYVVSGLIELPSLSIVYGSPGTLKSMLLADMAVCVSDGLPWLCQTPTPAEGGDIWDQVLDDEPDDLEPKGTVQVPTLWLDFDNGRRRTDERMEALAGARDLPISTPFHYITMPSPWLDAGDEESIDRLLWQVRALNAGLVVVDNLGVTKSCDENAPDMSLVMAGFRRISEDTGAAVVLIHHQRKDSGGRGRLGDTLRGHSSIEASLDLALLVRRDDGADTITIRSTKTRGVDVSPFAARFHFEHRPGTTELARAWFEGVPVETKTGKVNAAILETVSGDPGINKTGLRDTVRDMTGAGKRFVMDAIEWLTEHEKLRIEDGQRNAKLYYLAD